MSHRFLALALVSLTLVACGSEVASTPTASKDCVEGGKAYASGASWKCSDGCNSCSCSEGAVTSTTVACGCFDPTGFYLRGATWRCADGCNTCKCGDDFTVSSTLLACASDAGGVPSDASASVCFPLPADAHTSAACPSPEAFASIHVATFACSEKCLRCPTNRSFPREAYCDGAKWVVPADGGCEDGSGHTWTHGPPPSCAAD